MRIQVGVAFLLVSLAWVAFAPASAQEPPVEPSPATLPPEEGLPSLPGSAASLKEAIAKGGQVLKELEELERRWKQIDRREKNENRAHLEHLAGLEAQLTAANRGSADVADLFDELQRPLRDSFEELDQSMARAYRPLELDPYLRWNELVSSRSRIFDSEATTTVGSEGMKQIEEVAIELRKRIRGLKALEIELRIEDVERDAAVAGGLYSLRLATLNKLPFERLLQATSWTGEAREEIAIEMEAFHLERRLMALRNKGIVLGLAHSLGGYVASIVASGVLVKLLVILLLWRWAQRQRPKTLARLRERTESIGDLQRRQWSLGSLDFFDAVTPWGIYLLALGAIIWVLGPEARRVFLLVPLLQVMVVYGLYRLAVGLANGTLALAMRQTGRELDTEESENFAKGIQWVGRIAFVVAAVLSLYSLRLGKGVLYFKMRNTGWTLIILVLLWLIWRWRREVSEMFLAVRAEGWLADRVRRSMGKPSSLLTAPITFIWLCFHAFLALVRGLLLSFEQTRVATAYLSRRRLAKVASRKGYSAGHLESLPNEVVNALDKNVRAEDLEHLGLLTDLDVAARFAEVWRSGETSGCLLLAAEAGLGTSAWLDWFRSHENDVVTLSPNRRLLSPGKLRSWLSKELCNGQDPTVSQDELVENLCAGPRRIVVVERAENLFLATVNGYRALGALGPLIDETRHHIFWLLTMSGLAWKHLNAAGKELSFLRGQIVLEPWSQRQIGQLLEHRLEPTGYSINYADLMAMEGKKEDVESRQRMGRQTFQNLLWDFSAGNPSIALYFFARSLKAGDGKTLTAMPFRTPSTDDLSAVGNDALYLLAAVMRHGRLSAGQTAAATDFPVSSVEGMFMRLVDLGTVAASEGTYYVTTAWRATVLRLLRRHNILIS